MVAGLQYFQRYLFEPIILYPKTTGSPAAIHTRQDHVHHSIGGVFNIGRRNRFRSGWMRMEDGKQIQPIRLDPFKCLQLPNWIHHESHRTLRLILHHQNRLYTGAFARQKTARLKRKLSIDMRDHLLQM